jgi:3-oxoacyl-(acyl-carrier-protein) synthase
MKRNVVVTGMGIVSAAGFGREESFDTLARGASAVGSVRLFDTAGHAAGIAAGVATERLEARFSGRACRWDRATKLAVCAADEAMARLGGVRWEPGEAVVPARCRDVRAGVFLGTTLGGMNGALRYFRTLRDRGADRAPVAPLRDYRAVSQAKQLADRYQFGGRCVAVSDACAASLRAIQLAAFEVGCGRLDLALAGGVDPLCEFTHAGFGSLGLLAQDACRPFSAGRTGLVLGEGAAFVVLEPAQKVKREGREPLAAIHGYASTSDAHHVTQPEPEGALAAEAMRQALGGTEGEVPIPDYVCAHGTGTVHNDLAEARALARIFGGRLPAIPVSSVKSALGHTLGGAGAVSVVLTIEGMGRDFCLGTAAFTNLDPACGDLRVLGPEGAAQPVRCALVNAFGFGGANASLFLERAR